MSRVGIARGGLRLSRRESDNMARRMSAARDGLRLSGRAEYDGVCAVPCLIVACNNELIGGPGIASRVTPTEAKKSPPRYR